MPTFISDKRLDTMLKQGWTPQEVRELIAAYRELRDFVKFRRALARAKKSKEKRSPEEQAKLRPKNYAKLSEKSKWEIDKALGILDWSGPSAE